MVTVVAGMAAFSTSVLHGWTVAAAWALALLCAFTVMTSLGLLLFHSTTVK